MSKKIVRKDDFGKVYLCRYLYLVLAYCFNFVRTKSVNGYDATIKGCKFAMIISVQLSSP